MLWSQIPWYLLTDHSCMCANMSINAFGPHASILRIPQHGCICYGYPDTCFQIITAHLCTIVHGCAVVRLNDLYTNALMSVYKSLMHICARMCTYVRTCASMICLQIRSHLVVNHSCTYVHMCALLCISDLLTNTFIFVYQSFMHNCAQMCLFLHWWIFTKCNHICRQIIDAHNGTLVHSCALMLCKQISTCLCTNHQCAIMHTCDELCRYVR